MEQTNVSASELIDEDDILGMTVGITYEDQDELKREIHDKMDPDYDSRNEVSKMETAEDS